MYTIQTTYKKILADAYTPVGVYLNLRDRFKNTMLFESSENSSAKKSLSLICASPIASFKLDKNVLEFNYPDGIKKKKICDQKVDVLTEIQNFMDEFQVENLNLGFINNGFFGSTNFEASNYFNDNLDWTVENNQETPEMHYFMYRYLLVFNHFKDELYLIENTSEFDQAKTLEHISSLIHKRGFTIYNFQKDGKEVSNFTDDEFLDIIKKCKKECIEGNVEQIVPSRAFTQGFLGDEFNVYRALRSINPSPYLFFCDFGNYKIFGSSPETQINIEKRKAKIHPIAGTFKRTGDLKQDNLLAKQLKNDHKENTEHEMLVRAAVNELEKNCHGVKVSQHSEVQFYSHVIHLVSEVTGKLNPSSNLLKTAYASFPAGTLSGLPKEKALRLIRELEAAPRGFYGGCIGFFDFKDSFNQAITIRSFLSKNNRLTYQAGAGVIRESIAEKELEEVNNKLMALKSALDLAENFKNN